ncbi:hypothetical protein [Streptosporangium sp. KLBMP 9127]|nr:hypothetical protein [Streptosporangium sp. KLBMP 9127]
MIVRRAALLVGVLPLLALAGCGGTPAETGVASANVGTAKTATPSPTTSSDPLKFAQCMRENGVDMKDPDSSGRVSVMARGDKGQMEKAHKACGKYMQGGGMNKGRANDPKAQDAMLAFTKCMREQGIEMADPGAEGGAIKIQRPKGSEEEFEKAMKSCEEHLPGRPGTP